MGNKILNWNNGLYLIMYEQGLKELSHFRFSRRELLRELFA